MPPQTAQYLCLDLLLAFVNHMTARAEGVSTLVDILASCAHPSPLAKRLMAAGMLQHMCAEDIFLTVDHQNLVPVEDLQKTKAQKKLVLTGASKFNTKPKTGISFLEDNKLIYADPNQSRAHSLAVFLKTCTRLDKRVLGDFISKPDNLDVLKAFVGLFDFKNVSLVVRYLLRVKPTYNVTRNRWLTQCENCWNHSVCRENRSRSAGLQRRLQRFTLLLGQVRSNALSQFPANSLYSGD